MKRYVGFALAGAVAWTAYRYVTVTKALYPNDAYNGIVSAAQSRPVGLAAGVGAGLLVAWFTK